MRLTKIYFTFREARPHPRFLCILLSAATLAFSAAWAKPAGASKPASAVKARSSQADAPRVDSSKVHQLYLEGEFDAAITILENNLKETRQYSHGDSSFIYKHLGVMYAANFDTREKGKYYMHRLLLVEPTARIMDMYASDMIYMIFKNIKDEYEQSTMSRATLRQKATEDGDRTDRQSSRDKSDTPARRQVPADQPSGNGKKWLWTGVAVATVAASVGAYVLLSEEKPQTSEKEWKF